MESKLLAILTNIKFAFHERRNKYMAFRVTLSTKYAL